MRNYAETEKCLFAGDFLFSVADADNTKRPDVIVQFFTRPTRYQNVDPEAGCDVKVGLKPQSHDRGRSRTSRDATSESVVGRRTKLLNGFVRNTSGRPVYSFPSGSSPSKHLRRQSASQFLQRSGSTNVDWGLLF